jgi:hypothetical protein
MLWSQRIRAWLRRRVDPKRDSGPAVEVYENARPRSVRTQRVDRGAVVIVWIVAAIAVLAAAAIAAAPALIARAG